MNISCLGIRAAGCRVAPAGWAAASTSVATAGISSLRLPDTPAAVRTPSPSTIIRTKSRSRLGLKTAPLEISDWRDLVRKTVEEGQRNQTLAKLAGHLLRNRIDPWVALELLQAWNQTRCDPPLDDAELLATVRSIARREVERREGLDG